MGSDLPTALSPTDHAHCRGYDLVGLTEGRLGEAEVERILAHVDECPSCADVMRHMASYHRPKQCGRYELSQALGQGGMGTVYAAWDPQLHRKVAVKLMRPEVASADMRERMLREARALARVSHPNVVAVYDAGDADDEIYIATELIDGDTLTRWQSTRGPREILAAYLQVARGLAAAHAEGVVHRDVKPDNCLVGRDGRVRVGDFGLARESSDVPTTPIPRDSQLSPITMIGQVAGTPAYMAPEQRTGIVDPRSDQYSLCVSLVEGLTNERPDPDAAPVLPGPPAVQAVVARGLRQAPDERYPTMAGFADALAAAIEPPRPRRWWIPALAGVAAAGTVGVLALAERATGPACAIDPDVDAWSAIERVQLAAMVPPNVTPRLDAWLARWREAARGSCQPDVSPESRLRRAHCLHDQLAIARERLAQWAVRDPKAVPDSLQLELDGLPQASHCTREGWLPPEPNMRQVLRAAGERARRVQAHALPYEARERALEGLVLTARAIGHAPLLIEQAQALAAFQAHDDRKPDAAATLRKAAEDAERMGDTGGRARVLVALVPKLELAEAQAVATEARALLGRLGGDQWLEAELDYALAQTDRVAKSEWTTAAYERARVGYRATLGPGSYKEVLVLMALTGEYGLRQEALGRKVYEEAAAYGVQLGLPTFPAYLDDNSLSNLRMTQGLLARIKQEVPDSDAEMYGEFAVASAARILGDKRLALTHYERTIALGDKLKRRVTQLASALAQSARLHVELGDPGPAVELARRSIALSEELKSDRDLANGLRALGTVLIETGRLAEAIAPLERAMVVNERIGASPGQRGMTRFALAKALWPADPRRALVHAQGAQGDLELAVKTSAEEPQAIRTSQASNLTSIETWIRRHQR